MSLYRRDAYGQVAGGPVPWLPTPEGGENTATSTSTAVVWPSTAFKTDTVVRVVVTAEAYVAVAATPAPAAGTDAILVANVPEFIYLPAGQKIGVLAQTAGNVSFSPMQ